MNLDIATERTSTELSFDEIAHIARTAPKELISASVAERDDVSRAPGLILTKEDIINLKTYEATALALPSTLEDVKNYLEFGNANDGGPGLAHKDFLNTFTKTREHALRWAPLNDEIRLTSTKLKLFSNYMIIYGESITDLNTGIKNSEEIKKYLKSNNITTLAQLKNIKITSDEHFPGIALEKDTKKDLHSYLSLMFDQINTNLEETEALKKNITSFSDDLTNIVLPKIKTQLQLVSDNTVQTDITKLKNSIDERSLRIEEKNKEYAALVEKSFTSAASLNIAGLGMAIYMGVEAETTRNERNQLKEEQQKEIEKLSKKNQTLASLYRIKEKLVDLKSVTLDAETATKNLRQLWNSILEFVKASKKSADNINDTVSLGLFIHHFKLVVEPWREIQKKTDLFIKIFKEADQEYKQTHVNKMQQTHHTMEL